MVLKRLIAVGFSLALVVGMIVPAGALETPVCNVDKVNGLDEIPNLPVDYDRIMDLAPAGLGSSGTPQNFFGVANFNGSGSTFNVYYLDGLNASPVTSFDSGTDYIQEVQVTTGGFPAEYGGATNGVVNVVTRSGGNTWQARVGNFPDTTDFSNSMWVPYRFGGMTTPTFNDLSVDSTVVDGNLQTTFLAASDDAVSLFQVQNTGTETGSIDLAPVPLDVDDGTGPVSLEQISHISFGSDVQGNMHVVAQGSDGTLTYYRKETGSSSLTSSMTVGPTGHTWQNTQLKVGPNGEVVISSYDANGGFLRIWIKKATESSFTETNITAAIGDKVGEFKSMAVDKVTGITYLTYKHSSGRTKVALISPDGTVFWKWLDETAGIPSDTATSSYGGIPIHLWLDTISSRIGAKICF